MSMLWYNIEFASVASREGGMEGQFKVAFEFENYAESRRTQLDEVRQGTANMYGPGATWRTLSSHVRRNYTPGI